MFILADQRIPVKARKKLEKYGSVLWLEPQQSAYPAISAHPDIFFCRTGDHLVVAPDICGKIKDTLSEFKINYIQGNEVVGEKYPETARYNAVVTDRFLIGNTNYTDKMILEQAGDRTIIHVKQGYTRCNLIPLKNDRFITSDKGIEKKLKQYGLEVLYVSPEGILLPGFKNGFIGGTGGVWQNRLFFTGSLNHFPEGLKIRNFVQDMEIIELYNGPLFDGGSILFFSS